MIEASTIGYIGFQIGDFAALLQSHRIDCLIDVRELPLSRKRGFSKSSLREALEQVGIEYHHFRELGSPRVLRHAVRADGDYASFFRGMRKHLVTVAAEEAIGQVVRRIRRQRCCLMCCCADWSVCHRRAVVESVARKIAVRFDHITLWHDRQPKRRVA